MESIHKKMTSRVLIWGGSEGATVSGKAMSHAKMISATPTRPKGNFWSSSTKGEMHSWKMDSVRLFGQARVSPSSADRFCANPPCTYMEVRNPSRRTVPDRGSSVVRVRASRYTSRGASYTPEIVADKN